MIHLTILQFITVLFAVSMATTIFTDSFAYFFKKRPKIYKIGDMTINNNYNKKSAGKFAGLLAPYVVQAVNKTIEKLHSEGKIIVRARALETIPKGAPLMEVKRADKQSDARVMFANSSAHDFKPPKFKPSTEIVVITKTPRKTGLKIVPKGKRTRKAK
jgi:hypothetical protein